MPRIRTIDPSIVGNHHICHLIVSVQRRFGNAIHHRQRASELFTLQIVEVIVCHPMPCIDESNPSNIVRTVSNEIIPVNDAVVSMSCHQRTFRFVKDIVSKLIEVCLARNHFYLAIAFFKKIVGYQSIGRRHRGITTSQLNSFCLRPSFAWARTKMIVVDFVVVANTLIALDIDSDCWTFVRFSRQIAMV